MNEIARKLSQRVDLQGWKIWLSKLHNVSKLPAPNYGQVCLQKVKIKYYEFQGLQLEIAKSVIIHQNESASEEAVTQGGLGVFCL